MASEAERAWTARMRVEMAELGAITCQVCGHLAWLLNIHLQRSHRLTVAKYQERYPGAPVRSQTRKPAGFNQGRT